MKKVKLIIDQGNTQTKLALFGNKKLLRKGVLENPSTLPDWEHQADCTFLSSVSDPSALIQHLQREPLTFSSINKYPIKNGYQTTETLGNDRLAAVVAAATLFPAIPILVIDAGSCITYDLLTEEGYQGGSISPGLKMRLQALNQHTHRLPLVALGEKVPLIGKTTQQSIQSGVLNGVLAEVDGIIDRYKTNYSLLKVVFTGGDFLLFDKGLKNSIFADPDLVLKGLNEILDYNEAIS